jgi:hypothetical protein
MTKNKTVKKGPSPKRDGKGPHGPGKKNQNKPCPKGKR